MKKVLLAFVFCVLAVVSVRSQTTELEIIKSKYKVEKKEIVAEFMKFSEEEAVRFWPIYEEYEAERTKLGNKRVELLKRYASEYQTITDEQVDELISDVFDLHEDIISLREKYYGKVKEKLNARRAAGFVQIEEFLENIIRITIQANIPFFGDLGKK